MHLKCIQIILSACKNGKQNNYRSVTFKLHTVQGTVHWIVSAANYCKSFVKYNIEGKNTWYIFIWPLNVKTISVGLLYKPRAEVVLQCSTLMPVFSSQLSKPSPPSVKGPILFLFSDLFFYI